MKSKQGKNNNQFDSYPKEEDNYPFFKNVYFRIFLLKY